jgi:fructokinase
MIGAVEAGGTKMVCAVSDAELNIKARTRISTENPQDTMREILAFFSEYELSGLGVGAFGPIGVNPQRADYGFIGQTPKEGWSGFNLLGALQTEIKCPIFLTTDVNVAAYGELKRGSAQGLQNAVYLTVGTGIGGGIIHDGAIYVGDTHPELGHIMVKRAQDELEGFTGVCPYHKGCLEGMASGPSLGARAGVKANTLAPDDPLWDIEADYLAQAAMNYTLSFAPQRIIFGGGVSNQGQLFPKLRTRFGEYLNHYVQVPDYDEYLVHAALGDDAGITGALLLAAKVAE